jgi:flavin-binding protein dodecin
VRGLRSDTRSHISGELSCRTHVYKVTELVGSSEKSIEDAIKTAISRASKTLRNLRWFEVEQIRGHVADDGVHHYQVTLKVGFTLQDK